MKLLFKIIRNQKGFTLIESLLSLYILSFISILLIMLLSTLLFQTNSKKLHPFELENFVIQAQSELREANEWGVNNNVIFMTSRHDEHITYSTYNELIRRQVEGRGHEVLLQNVSSFSCEEFDNGIKLNITDINGNKFIRYIYRMGEWSE